MFKTMQALHRTRTMAAPWGYWAPATLLVLAISVHCRSQPPTTTSPMSESSVMAPPRAPETPPETVDEDTQVIDFGTEPIAGGATGPEGDIGPMQPRRKDIPGFVLPGTTGPKACRGEVCESVQDPFPDVMYPAGRPEHP